MSQTNKPSIEKEPQDNNGIIPTPFKGKVAGGEDSESKLPITNNPTSEINKSISGSLSQLQQDKNQNLLSFSRSGMSWIFNIGLVSLMTIYVTWLCNVNTTTRDKQKSIDERFLKTIELIGHDKVNVRTGGIIALKQIFQESEEKKQESIELLANLIRINAPFPTDEEKTRIKNQKNIKSKNQKNVVIKNDNSVLADVTMALRIIKKTPRKIEELVEIEEIEEVEGRQQTKRVKEVKKVEAIDLSRVNLYNTDLSNGNLENISFNFSNLNEVNLSNANLKGSFLKSTNLKNAAIEGANLEGANLEGASFDDSKIKKACNWEHAIYDDIAEKRLKPDIHSVAKTTEECRKEFSDNH